jgi:formylmethanofuran dehydrogenase subunit E-like metal-binding protein
MKEIIIKDKQKYLQENYPFEEIPNMTDLKHCIHCDKDIVVGDFKVFLEDGEEYIYCPNSPECDWTIINWI